MSSTATSRRRYRPATVGMWNGQPSVDACQDCGAAVTDRVVHDRWHGDADNGSNRG